MNIYSDPHRLLIVDDVPAVREALRWVLENEPDLDVIGEAGDGLEALARAVELAPDVVILDVELPVLSGVLVARALKARMQPPLIVFLTVHGDSNCRALCAAAGGDGFAEKGAGWDELISEVRSALARRGS